MLLWVVASSLSTAAQEGAAYAVERVIDGDTIVLEDIGTVRLIGVDTPESVDPREPVQYFARESAAYLRSLVDGRRVRLAYDWQRVDKYNRVLAYVYLADDTFVNDEIVRQGYSSAYVKYPFRYLDQFRAAEREARAGNRGLWAGGSPALAGTQAIAGSVAAPVRVWVNTSSGIYHCPGTRYYGNTARGAYVPEAEAKQKGNRAAYGRECGPSSAAASEPAPAATRPRSLTTTQREPANAGVRVWVNTSSRVYHCPGTRYYGNTTRGEFMSESAARGGGNRPSAGKACS